LRKSVVPFSTNPLNAVKWPKLKIRFLFKAVFQSIKVVLATHQREKKSLFDEKKNHHSDFCTLSDTFRGFLVMARAGCGAMLQERRDFGRDWLPRSLRMVDSITPVLHALPNAIAHGSSSSSDLHSAPHCFSCCHRAAVYYSGPQPAGVLNFPTSSFTMAVTLYFINARRRLQHHIFNSDSMILQKNLSSANS
jgi:hypothetical protein